MGAIPLSPLDLALAAALVGALALTSVRLGIGVGRELTVSAVRTVVQLLLVGLVLKALFAHAHPLLVGGLALAMLLAAGREVRARQTRRFAGAWGFGLGTGAMFVSSFTVAIFALAVLIRSEPWYAPQYAVPLLGMLLGNTMTGIAVGLERLTSATAQQRAVIEERLLLGEDRDAALADLRRESARSGLIPIVNAMAAAGIVSLPGMMTGQILAGSPPVEAVKYQILILFLIAAGTGFGVLVALRLAARRLFDERHRLRLDRLLPPSERRA